MSTDSLPLLRDLARLAALLAAPDAPAALRRTALRGAARRARHAGAVAEWRADGALVVAGAPAPSPELDVLRVPGVRRLVVHRGATARELAHFAALLTRPPGTDVVAELAAMRLWHVQLDAARPAVDGALPADAERIAAAVRDASDPAQVADAVAALGRWIADAAPGGSAIAAVLGCVVEHALALEPARDHGRVAALAGLLASTDLAPIVDAAVDGAVPGALAVLQCVTPAAVPLLVERLAATETLDARRRCWDTLLALGAGVDVLVATLADARWYVVRNVALMLGELRADDAVRPLARTLGASDARVRMAAATALARIGTAPALHVLCGALRDRDVDVRHIVARGVADAARRGAVVAAPMVVAALQAEDDGDTAAELLAALGAVGSDDAVRHLHWVAAGRMRDADDWERRAAAAAALARVRTPAAAAARRALRADPDAAVRRLAEGADA